MITIIILKFLLITAMASTLWDVKKCRFMFDYNSDFSWSIFVLSVPVETGMNTLQRSEQNKPL